MATETKTTTSQPSRARRAESPSVRAFRASIGEMLPARRAGPRAAARVTTTPDDDRGHERRDRQAGLVQRSTSPTVRTQATMTAARIDPMTTPSSEPTTPSRNAWRSTNPVIWPRVAPAARRRPSSRARSTSVIESVLKMRKAPVNRAIAAMSAVVAWKSAVEDRSEAARSAGDDEDVRFDRADDPRGPSRRRPDPRRRRARDRPREMASWSKTAWAVRSGTMTVRPSVPTVGPSPSRIPTTR